MLQQFIPGVDERWLLRREVERRGHQCRKHSAIMCLIESLQIANAAAISAAETPALLDVVRMRGDRDVRHTEKMLLGDLC